MVVTMMTAPVDFTESVKIQALERQRNRCGSCDTAIAALGRQGIDEHDYGEGAQAHHIRHKQQGGRGNVENCVILCQSCHYTVHEGGNYRSKNIMADVTDFEHYYGRK